MNKSKPKNDFCRPFVILIIIIVLGFILRLGYRCGLCNPDSYAYIAGAVRINDNGLGEYLSTLSNIYENRISIVLPLALILKLFGLSEFTVMLLPLFYAVGTTIVVYLLGKQLFDPVTGLLAALLVATIPLDVFYSTAVLPDSIIPFYVGLTLLFFTLGQKKGNRLFYLLSGFFLFGAVQARATSGALIFPLLLIAWWSSKRDVWSFLLPTCTFLSLILIYWGILFLVSGDFFLQLKLFAQVASAEKYVGTGEFLGHFKNIFRVNNEFGFLYLIAFPACLIALYKAGHDQAYRLPVITFIALYLFFEFGSTSFTSYQPIWKLSRFLTILSVPVSLVTASVTTFFFSMSRRWLRLASFTLLTMHILLVVALFPLYNKGITQFILDYNYPYKTTFAKLDAYKNIETIQIMNSRWSLRGQFYARVYGHTYQYQDIKNKSIDDIENGDIVIYDPIFFTPYGEYELDRLDYPALQSLPEELPGNWQLLFIVNRPTNANFPVYVYLVKI